MSNSYLISFNKNHTCCFEILYPSPIPFLSAKIIRVATRGGCQISLTLSTVVSHAAAECTTLIVSQSSRFEILHRLRGIMNIVVDIQGLKDKYNNFVPKEIAVVSVKTAYIAHWIVSQPYAYNVLPPSVKRQNTWLKCNHHGIEWSEGETPLRSVEVVLKKIAVQSDRLFTRGADTTAYLSQLTDCFVINLEEDEEPPSRNLPESTTFCIFHGLLHKNGSFKCALNNAVRVKKWLSHSDRSGCLWMYRTTTSWNAGLLAAEHRKEGKAGDIKKSSS